jgi:hypothetical protein
VVGARAMHLLEYISIPVTQDKVTSHDACRGRKQDRNGKEVDYAPKNTRKNHR